jgi:hypothetical protein
MRSAVPASLAALAMATGALAASLPEIPRERAQESERDQPRSEKAPSSHIQGDAASIAALRAGIIARDKAKATAHPQPQTVSAKTFVASQGKPGGRPVLATQRARRADRETARTVRRREAEERARKQRESAAGSGPADPCGIAVGAKKCPR